MSSRSNRKLVKPTGTFDVLSLAIRKLGKVREWKRETEGGEEVERRGTGRKKEVRGEGGRKRGGKGEKRGQGERKGGEMQGGKEGGKVDKGGRGKERKVERKKGKEIKKISGSDGKKRAREKNS